MDIGRLSGCFKHTSATYKFYWVLALLSEVEQGKERIEKKALFAHMVSQAWYTVNYFKVSFGANDHLQQAIEELKELESLPVDASPDAVLKWMTSVAGFGQTTNSVALSSAATELV